MQTLVLFDFDGTVAPYSGEGGRYDMGYYTADKGYHAFKFGLHIQIHERVLSLLNTLHETPGITVKWCSSWDESTSDFHDKSDGLIPSFEYLRTFSSGGKDKAVKQELETDRWDRVIVIDDGVGVARRYRALGDDRLVVMRTKPNEGILDRDVYRIKELSGIEVI